MEEGIGGPRVDGDVGKGRFQRLDWVRDK